MRSDRRGDAKPRLRRCGESSCSEAANLVTFTLVFPLLFVLFILSLPWRSYPLLMRNSGACWIKSHSSLSLSLQKKIMFGFIAYLE